MKNVTKIQKILSTYKQCDKSTKNMIRNESYNQSINNATQIRILWIRIKVWIIWYENKQYDPDINNMIKIQKNIIDVNALIL